MWAEISAAVRIGCSRGRFIFIENPAYKIIMEKDEKKADIKTTSSRVFFGGKTPLGVVILGGLNLFVLGIASFIFFFFLHQSLSSSSTNNLFEGVNQEKSTSFAGAFFEDIKKYFPEKELEEEQLKIALIMQMAIALIFFASGLGILLRKEKARRLTLYFSFFMVILAVLSVVFNPSTISQAILQIIYPGILILYFTSKKIEKYFVLARRNTTQGEE